MKFGQASAARKRTRQRWWSPRELKRIRLGVLMGQYHARADYADRYIVLAGRALAAFPGEPNPLSLYERGLLAGYEFEKYGRRRTAPHA